MHVDVLNRRHDATEEASVVPELLVVDAEIGLSDSLEKALGRLEVKSWSRNWFRLLLQCWPRRDIILCAAGEENEK